MIEPLLPNKPLGLPRIDDRRVLNGIFRVLRSGAPWCDLPERYGPRTTCYNRFVRWRKAAGADATDDQNVDQFIRRLTFSVLVGNGDMHFKSWSLILTIAISFQGDRESSTSSATA